MPRGGSRPGAGRKPTKPKVVNIDGKPRADVIPPAMQAAIDQSIASDSPLLEPPADLSEARKTFWREWAPLAVAEGTLTEATVLGFRELSEQFVIKDTLGRQCEAKEPGWGEAFKLWVKATQRVDSSMARFKLTALGKSATPKRAPTAVNPWARVAAPAVKR